MKTKNIELKMILKMARMDDPKRLGKYLELAYLQGRIDMMHEINEENKKL